MACMEPVERYSSKPLREAERAQRKAQVDVMLDRTLADILLVTGRTSADVMARSRTNAPLRFAWWWLAHHAGGVAFAEIARATGRHHTTVMTAVDRALDVPESESIILAVLAGEALAAAGELAERSAA